MKPEHAKRLRKAREAMVDAQGESLRAFLAGESPMDQIQPDLIPTEREHNELRAAIRRINVAAHRHPRGSSAYERKAKPLPMLIARLVVVERALQLDRLERAALTPRMLADMAHVSHAEIEAKARELAGMGEAD